MRPAQDQGTAQEPEPARDGAPESDPEPAPAPALQQCQRADLHFWKLLLGGALKKGDPS